MLKKFTLFLFCSYLVGCATPSVIPKNYNLNQDSKIVPINLGLDSNQYFVNRQAAELLQYISYSMNSSGQFEDINRYGVKWPYSVQIHYTWDRPVTATTFISNLFSALTLLIVPSFSEEHHRMEVAVYHHGTLLKQLEYRVTTEVAMSLWHDILKTRKSAVKDLLEQLYTDIREKNLMPTMGEVSENNSSADRAI